MIRIHLCGQIKDNCNYLSEFEIEATKQRALYLDAEIFNPAEIDPKNFLPEDELLLICLDALRDADIAVFIAGWEKSKGAKTEMAFIEALNSYRKKQVQIIINRC